MANRCVIKPYVAFFFILLIRAPCADSSLQFMSLFCKYAESVCPNDDITFYLSTTNGILNLPILDTTIGVAAAPIINGAPLIVLLHGFNGSLYDTPSKELLLAYLQKAIGKLNVLVASFPALVAFPCYPASVWNTPQIGSCVGRMLRLIFANNRVSSLNTHIIGFSLGAHIAAVAANSLGLYGYQLDRITALDAALPGFEFPSSNRLSTYSAKFVDAIHTNCGGYGIIEPIGHVDFYINNGRDQPLCNNVTNILVDTPLKVLRCSHFRSAEYFQESMIGAGKFQGRRCFFFLSLFGGICFQIGTEEATFGEYVSRSAFGTYKVMTNQIPPWAKD